MVENQMTTFIFNWIMCGVHYEVDSELHLATNRITIIKCRILHRSNMVAYVLGRSTRT